MGQGSLHPSRRHQSSPDVDNIASACVIEQERMLCLHASTTAEMNTICTHPHSSAPMKDIRILRRSSSSSSSSSSTSSDELPPAPAPINFKRWRHPRPPRVPHRYHKNDGPPLHSDRVDERSVAEASKLCIQQRLSSPKYALADDHRSDALHSTPLISSKRCRTLDLNCVKVPTVTGDDLDDVDKENTRKLIMWQAACAMAHAYLHQHDLHQRKQHELSSHIPHSCHLVFNDESLQEKGPHLQEDICESQLVTEQINNPLPSPSSPLPTSSKDGECRPSSTCLPNEVDADVVCIDEVVNPTQAAEWFGALFSSTSTLVS